MGDDRCDCAICVRSREIDRHLGALTGEARQFFQQLVDDLYETQDELNHKAAILDGSWPFAVARLEAALISAREIAAQRGYDPPA